MVLSAARAWETLGARAFSTFAGVVLMEAAKQIYAGHAVPARERAAAYLPIAQRTPREAPRVPSAPDPRPNG